MQLDEFSLDGRARFAIKLFPLQHRYVGAVFEQPKAQNLLSNDVFYNAYEQYPPICSLLSKRYDNGRPYIAWLASNIAGKKIRKGGWSPLRNCLTFIALIYVIQLALHCLSSLQLLADTLNLKQRSYH